MNWARSLVSGRYRYTDNYERNQLPLVRALATPEADKRHVVLPTANRRPT